MELPVSVSVVCAYGLRDTEEDRLDFLDAHWAQRYYKHKRHYSGYRLVSEASIDTTQGGHLWLQSTIGTVDILQLKDN